MTYDIEIKNLVKKYGSLTAVNELNLHVPEGKILGLIGPDGAGKTTTLRILCGLLTMDSGECQMGEYTVNRNLKAIRTIIGYMPQRFSLYPDLTVSENITFFANLFNVSKPERKKQSERLLKFSRLDQFTNRRAGALSGGMKQKLALSCMLVHTPKILLLDEPTFGVDPVSRREFWEILQELRTENVTILVTTPYMDEAAKCDIVSFMHKGELLLTDQPQNIPSYFTQNLIEVKCDNIVTAFRHVTQKEGIHSAQIFGDKLHVAGEEQQELRYKVRQVLNENQIDIKHIKNIKASIEDVFVELIKREKGR